VREYFFKAYPCEEEQKEQNWKQCVVSMNNRLKKYDRAAVKNRFLLLLLFFHFVIIIIFEKGAQIAMGVFSVALISLTILIH